MANFWRYPVSTFQRGGLVHQLVCKVKGSWNIVAASLFFGVAGTAVTPGVGQVDATGFAPTVQVTSNQTITPGLGQLIATGQAPTVIVNTIILPGFGQVSVSGLAPTIKNKHHCPTRDRSDFGKRAESNGSGIE
jgi:hypothetical protein